VGRHSGRTVIIVVAAVLGRLVVAVRPVLRTYRGHIACRPGRLLEPIGDIDKAPG
jgi:hypothetical protein